MFDNMVKNLDLQTLGKGQKDFSITKEEFGTKTMNKILYNNIMYKNYYYKHLESKLYI